VFFDITSSDMPGMVNIPLDLPGTYDFDLATPFITGTFDHRDALSVSVFANIVGNNIPVFGIPLDSFRRTGEEFTAESSFGFFIDNWFSIEVQQQQPAVVPEPSTWITGITGVNFLAVGAFWFRRRSPAAMSFHST
jgi:hypothetical protein